MSALSCAAAVRPCVHRILETLTHVTGADASLTMTDVDASAPPEAADVGLPKWLEELLKPGVSQGVFTMLKACLVGLVLMLCVMLAVLEEATIRMLIHGGQVIPVGSDPTQLRPGATPVPAHFHAHAQSRTTLTLTDISSVLSSRKL